LAFYKSAVSCNRTKEITKNQTGGVLIMKKKLLTVLVAAALAAATLVSCGKQNDTITVVSREDGSGTRGAFTELMGIEKDGTDRTYAKAEISNSTSVVISTVAGNKNAIGYISLGSLNDSVKAVKIDGVDATVDNVKNGSYKISRPFIIATKDGISDLAADFIKFILSDDGQAIVSEKYITVGGSGAYTASGLSGKVTLAGSTSVSPLMDELAAAYKELNPDVVIEIQQSGSGAGIQSALEGVCDIGMSSRELKDSEKEAGLTPTVMALDGIAVIVNKDNGIGTLSSEQIQSIYIGESTSWADVK
jgi:phosphate transport system substrate-binding protein